MAGTERGAVWPGHGGELCHRCVRSHPRDPGRLWHPRPQVPTSPKMLATLVSNSVSMMGKGTMGPCSARAVLEDRKLWLTKVM